MLANLRTSHVIAIKCLLGPKDGPLFRQFLELMLPDDREMFASRLCGMPLEEAVAFATEKVAWFKAMAWRRDRQREKTVSFSEDTLHEIATAAESLADDAGERLQALRACLSRLSPAEVRLLQLRYVEGGSLTGHAIEQQMKPNRVQKTISRLRLALRHCIETKLSRA